MQPQNDSDLPYDLPLRIQLLGSSGKGSFVCVIGALPAGVRKRRRILALMTPRSVLNCSRSEL